MANADFQRAVSEKLHTSITEAFFYGFHIASKDLTLSSALFVVSVGIQFIQMLYFPVALLLNAGEFGDILGTVLRISNLVKIDTDVGETGMLIASALVRALNRFWSLRRSHTLCCHFAGFASGSCHVH
jgi:hypothetical protein